MIKAPFNFVPLNKKVVYPYWADFVSHDIPFSDGLSGCLELKIEAVSPIFVRNGQSQDSTKHKDNLQEQLPAQQEFSNDQGRYFLPGTSVKGAVRSVLEIMSFCQLDDKVNDHKYSFRDLRDNQDYLPSFRPDKIKGGWLSYDKKNETYKLISAGKPGRIRHVELDKGFSNFFYNQFPINRRLTDHQKTAKFKYDSMLNEITEYKIKVTKSFTDYGLDYYELSDDSALEGYLVLTGQPTPSGIHGGGGKNSEFIFFEESGAKSWELGADSAVIRNFKFAYFEHDTTKTSEDWKFWRSKLNAGEKIPVFYSVDDSGKDIAHMGLSYLYKLPFKNSVQNSIKRTQNPEANKLDMSAVIFGHVQKTPLKGRVTFGHAFSNNAQPMEPTLEVLGSPKASYYPIYINQPQPGRYMTFMHEAAEISGWKRYPVRIGKDTIRNQPPEIRGQINNKVATRFTPIRQGAVFQCKIHYHNLRKIELGALLSALTFHQTPDAYHSLGMAKPLGYGKVKMHVSGIDNHLMYSCLGAYETFMEDELRENRQGWRQSEQLRELLSMSIEPTDDSELAYMNLNEHSQAKVARQFLSRYAQRESSRRAVIPSFLDRTDITAATLQQERERLSMTKIPIDDNINKQIKEKEEAAYQRAKEEQKNTWQQALRKLEEQLSQSRLRLRELQEKRKSELIKAETSANAHKLGPDWSSFSVGKDLFDSLSKFIRIFLLAYYKVSNDKHLPTEAPIFPESFRAKLMEVTEQLFREQVKSKKDQQKWVDKNSAQRKKFELWLGKQQADALFDRLRNIADGK